MHVDVIFKLLLIQVVTDEGAHGAHLVALLVLGQVLSAEAREGYEAVLARGDLKNHYKTQDEMLSSPLCQLMVCMRFEHCEKPPG